MMNKELLQNELQKLINEGRILRVMFYWKAQISFSFSDEDRKLARNLDAQKYVLDKEYNSFYTRSSLIIEKILPNRINEFHQCYKLTSENKLAKYDISTYLIRVQCISLSRDYELEAIKLFERQLSILESAYDTLNTVVFNIENDIRQNIYVDELDSAEHLLDKGYIRAAGSIAGVVLENHLKTICKSVSSITLKGDETLYQYNANLKSILGNILWGRIDAISRIRNLCDHAKEETPTKADVLLLINETRNLLKEISPFLIEADIKKLGE